MNKLILILTAFLLPGCATFEANTQPFAEIALAYQLDSDTDYWLQMDRDWQCNKQPQFHATIGVDTHPEVYYNNIRVSKEFGGY